MSLQNRNQFNYSYSTLLNVPLNVKCNATVSFVPEPITGRKKRWIFVLELLSSCSFSKVYEYIHPRVNKVPVPPINSTTIGKKTTGTGYVYKRNGTSNKYGYRYINRWFVPFTMRLLAAKNKWCTAGLWIRIQWLCGSGSGSVLGIRIRIQGQKMKKFPWKDALFNY
jgi:hypothetical protein